MAYKTAGLINLATQLDEVFPDRKKPDGWIADEHHTGTSSHHPDDTPGRKPEWNGDPDSRPDVRAIDVSYLLGEGVSSRAVVDHIAELPNLGSVVRYIIHQGVIWHVRNGFAPREHNGDAHPTHIHFTFAFTESADDNTTFDYRLEEIPVALTTADKSWLTNTINNAVQTRIDDIARAVTAALDDAPIRNGRTLGGSIDALCTPGMIGRDVWGYRLTDPLSSADPKATKPAGDYQRWPDSLHLGTRKVVTDAAEVISTKLDELLSTPTPQEES